MNDDYSMNSSIHSMVLCVEAALFGIFVVSLLVDQIYSIINDRTFIDRLKNDQPPRQIVSKMILFRKIFGPGQSTRLFNLYNTLVSTLGPMIWWLFPCNPRNSNQSFDYQTMHQI